MLYAPLQLTGCFIDHLCSRTSRMVRSEGLSRESSGIWYTCGIYLYLPPYLRFFVTQLIPIYLSVFVCMLSNSCHVLHKLLLPIRITRYSMRTGSHNRELSVFD